MQLQLLLSTRRLVQHIKYKQHEQSKQATMAKRMKIDPHCQRQNCCALKILLNSITLAPYVPFGISR